jgi:hypothetical protein
LSDVSAAVARTKPQARSRMSNGTLLPTTDGRSTWARYMRDTLASLVAHCGGDEVVSETKRLAARRVAVLESELVFLEDRFAQLRAAGDEPEASMIDLYARVANQQRRLAEALGWERTARDVTPSIEQFIHEIQAHKTAGNPAGESDALEPTREPQDATHAPMNPSGEASS